MGAPVDVEEVSLAGVLELGFVFVGIDIAVVCFERVFVFELVGTFIAEAVGLAGEGADSHLGAKRLASCYKFENVALLDCFHVWCLIKLIDN